MLKFTLPLFAAHSVLGFSPLATSRPALSHTTLFSSYDEQYQQQQSYAAPQPNIQPMMPEAPPDDERNYGFRLYNDMARDDSALARPQEPQPGRRLRPDNSMGQVGRYGSDAYENDQQRIQGNSLQTYGNYGGSNTVDLTTDGRDMYANVEMWAGPDNTAQKVSLYSQDGSQYRVRTTFSTNQQNSVAIRNQGNLEFPISASVTSQPYMGSFGATQAQSSNTAQAAREGYGQRKLIQGEGMVETFTIDAEVQSIKVVLETEGMPLYANVELLQGPNNAKVLGDVYNDGVHGPFEAVIDTPGVSSVLRITNTGPMAYPFHAYVEPLTFGQPRPVYNSNTESRFGADGRFREW